MLECDVQREHVPVLLMARHLHLGGSERQLTELARRLDRFCFEPHVACLRPGGMRERDLTAAGVPVLSLSVNSFASRGAITGARRLVAYIREHQIRLVHAFDWPTIVYALPIARAFTGAAVLSSQRAHRDLTPGAWRHGLRMTDRLVDGIVVNCEFVQRHVMEDEKVPAGMLHLVRNGLDIEAFCAGSAPNRPKPDGEPVVIGTICALRPEKSISTLIEAFARLRPRHPTSKLVIVGDGICLEDLRRQAEQHGITSACMFHQGTSEVARWLQMLDVFVLPSASEALSNSIMEAMACGCCVVASRVGGNPELVTDGETGALFRAGDAEDLASVLNSLLLDPCRRTALADAGTNFIREHFSLAGAAIRMGEVYDTVLRSDDSR